MTSKTLVLLGVTRHYLSHINKFQYAQTIGFITMTISSNNSNSNKNTTTNKAYLKQFLSSFRIEDKDVPFALGGIGMAGYLGFSDPALLVTLLMSIVIAGSLYFLSACLSSISKKLQFRISIWHLLTVICGLTFALNAYEPSHALFLSGLETGVTDLLGDDASVTDAQIATLFTFIRIALVLVSLGGGFAAWQQQQQGQSMTPIIMFVGGLFGIVLAIDIMTAVVL